MEIASLPFLASSKYLIPGLGGFSASYLLKLEFASRPQINNS